MLNSGNNMNRSGGVPSSDVPPLRHCLPLEQITLGSQKYGSGELRRILGVPTRSTSEEHSVGNVHLKPPPPVSTKELKHVKESMQDSSREASDRAKKLRDCISKLDKYLALCPKKRRRDISPGEGLSRMNPVKIGSQMPRNSQEVMTQGLEERTKCVGLNKRTRTLMPDVREDSRTAVVSRQQVVTEKTVDLLPAAASGPVRIEEKIRRLPAGGDGWDTKMKRKRSVAAVGNRTINGDRDVKRTMQPKLTPETKLRTCDAQSFRSKCSPGAGSINKFDSPLDPESPDASTAPRNEIGNISHSRDRAVLLQNRANTKREKKANYQDHNSANGPSITYKGNVSRAPRTGPSLVIDSSSKAQFSSAPQDLEQSPPNKVPAIGLAKNQKLQISGASSSHSMAQWVGQRPHKNSRTRRTNLVSPVLNHYDNQNSPQGFDSSPKTSFGTSASLLASGEINAPKVKREAESATSPFGLSESEESGAGDNKLKENGVDGSEVTPSRKAGASFLPIRKSKINDSGGALSTSRSGFLPAKEHIENTRISKPVQSMRAASDRNKSKTGRPPSKKLKERKVPKRFSPNLNSVSSDFTGESDDDHDDLFTAANLAHKASSLACSGLFWKKMKHLLAYLSSEDLSYLKQELCLAQELDTSLSQMYNAGNIYLSAVIQKASRTCSGREQISNPNQELSRTDDSLQRFRMRSSDKLYKRVLSALIEEDCNEEFSLHNEGKHMPLHYASDDSHCGSCNHIDAEPKDRDRMESEVESNADFQASKNCLPDRLSSDRGFASNSSRNATMSNSVHSYEPWPGDDEISHTDTVFVSEIYSNNPCQTRTREINIPLVSSSDQYQLMCLDDRILMELHSIDIYPETLPDLTEEEPLNQEILEMKKALHQQVQTKKNGLVKLDQAIWMEKDEEKRRIEQAAIDQLVEMAYRKRMACRGSNASKVRKVSRQSAMAFVKRTLARCRKFEETGTSCFSEPGLQDALFAPSPCEEAKSADYVGSGTASNTFNEASNLQAEARGSGAVSSTKRREAFIDDVVGSASSRITSSLGSTVLNGARGKRSDRDKSERKTKTKQKQKNNQSSTHPTGALGRAVGSSLPKDAIDAADYASLPLPDLDALGVPNELGATQDLSNFLNFDIPLDGDGEGLDIPLDDISDLLLF